MGFLDVCVLGEVSWLCVKDAVRCSTFCLTKRADSIIDCLEIFLIGVVRWMVRLLGAFERWLVVDILARCVEFQRFSVRCQVISCSLLKQHSLAEVGKQVHRGTSRLLSCLCYLDSSNIGFYIFSMESSCKASTVSCMT